MCTVTVVPPEASLEGDIIFTTEEEKTLNSRPPTKQAFQHQMPPPSTLLKQVGVSVNN